jgi:hypothetical protein
MSTSELASIEGFDEDTAGEIQSRAQEHLAAVEAELDEARALGVEDALREVEGVTTAMMVALGENDVKSVEDLAGCATTISSAGPSARTARPPVTPAISTGLTCRVRTRKRSSWPRASMRAGSRRRPMSLRRKPTRRPRPERDRRGEGGSERGI